MVVQSSGSNVIPRRARPGLAGLRPHTPAGISKDKAAQQAVLQKVQSYEEAFAKIQASTGISDIDELVATFIDAEDKNFSLFNYVNELNNEVRRGGGREGGRERGRETGGQGGQGHKGRGGGKEGRERGSG